MCSPFEIVGTRGRRVVLILFAAFVMLANVATAGQTGTSASIIGQVRDETGAILPGVTVTATGPALLVPEVADVTNERGEYRLTPLPIGTYTVVYTLSGFSSVRREELRLTAGFVATVNIVLAVGSIEESVTVTGAAPVVDVSSTGARTEFTRETLEITPSGRNGLISLFAQMPSVRSNIDVGGSASSDTLSIRVYGVRSESWQTLEGIVTTESRDTQGGNYFDYNTFEEVRAQTLSNEANVPGRGVYVNMLVKSGGNEFHGSGIGAATAQSLQSNNLDDKLRAQGFSERSSKLNARWDAGFDIGGPVVPNLIWFYHGARYRLQDRPLLGVFKPDGSPGNQFQSQTYFTEKVSYQMTPGNRLVGFSFWHRKRDEGSGLTPQSAWESGSISKVTTPQAKIEWQMVRGNSLVTTLQWAYWRWTALRVIPEGVGPSASDIATLKVWGMGAGQGNDSGAWRRAMARGTVSYYRPNWFWGNHEFNGGFDVIPNSTSRPWRPREVGDYRLRFNNDVPFEIVTTNAPSIPVTSATHTGIYAKDNWTIHPRVNLNLGLRFAHDNGFIPAQCHKAGQFTEAACIDKISDALWTSWVPRIYFAYDVTGDARTVIKGGWGRFAHWRTTDEVLPLNPFVGTLTTYRWRDLNGNRNYDAGEVNLAVNGPDFVSSAISDTGAITDGIVNPDQEQPYEDELSVSFERELIANFALRVSGRYSERKNILRRLYPLRPYEAYNIPITRPDPGPDGRVGTADDTGQSLTYYDFPAALAGRQFQQNMLVKDPDATQTYKTIEVAGTKRLSNRWQVMASYSATKLNVPVPAFTPFNPNEEINKTDRNWESLARLSGAYVLPGDVTTSFSFDHRSGLAQARQVLVTGGRQIPSIVLNVEPLGTRFDPSIDVMDLRVEKRFRLGDRQSVNAQVNVFNLLNVNTPTSVTYRSGPIFLQPTAIVLPRIVEFAATYRF